MGAQAMLKQVCGTSFWSWSISGRANMCERGIKGWAWLSRALVATALALICVILDGCESSPQTFEISATFECTNYNETDKVCKKWTQSGEIIIHERTASCFPGEATVTTRTGLKPMSELGVGEEILGLNHATGNPEFSAVRAWLHRDVEAEVPMLAVDTDAGVVVTSSKHLLAVVGGSETDYEFAGDILPGYSSLVARNGSPVAVRAVSKTYGRGRYAPLTWSSNFFVGEAETGVLAHSFAQLPSPRRYEAALHFVLSALETIVPSLHDVGDADKEYMHPVARACMWLWGVPLDAGFEREIAATVSRDFGLAASSREGPSAASRRLKTSSTSSSSTWSSSSEDDDDQDETDMQIVGLIVKSLPPFFKLRPDES
eukprot:NODE_1086_length_1244_cov_244.814130.p1 GENE.NODE_1086_length_1244_cov_244.814130~~NODE_1086_length_1244_cov_244.814130.p1  ORF type:complete len:373 (+),score=59.23 NODE_1086_length_1244_cov_244.814130:69-1187(+)